jgi:hypothetical protein
MAQVAAAALLACPDCAYRTARRFNLKKHVEGVHGRSPRHVCAECDAAFRHAGSLRQHQHSAHLGALYACSMCDKVKSSVLDPHCFQCGSGSSSLGQCGSETLKNLQLKKNLYFFMKNCNLIIPRPL